MQPSPTLSTVPNSSDLLDCSATTIYPARQPHKWLRVFIRLSLALIAITGISAESPFTGTFDFAIANGLGSTINYNGTAIPNLTVGQLKKVGVSDGSSTNNCRASAWATGSTGGAATPGGTIDTAKYFQFTITAQGGHTISNLALTFGVGRSGTGPRQFEWRSSLNSFATALPVTAKHATLALTGSNVLQTPDADAGYTGNVVSESSTEITSITFRFYAYGSETTAGTGGLQGNLSFGGTLTPPPAPTVLVNGELSAPAAPFVTVYGSASAVQVFSIAGSSLTEPITATAPNGFEISADGVNYAVSATLPQTAGAATGGIRVRLRANAPAGGYNSQNIVLSSAGAVTANITTTMSGNIVSPAPLTVSGLTASNKSYDGTTDAVLAGTAVYSGLVNGEAVDVSGTPLASFETASAGTAKAIRVTGYNAPNANYALTQPTGLTADITRKSATVTANDATKVFGVTLTGATGSSAFSSVGMVPGEAIGSVTLSYLEGHLPEDPPQLYQGAIIPSAATGGSFDPENYAISYVAGALNVIAAPEITAAGVLGAVSTTYGVPSPVPTTFSVSGTALMGSLIVTAPDGHQISTNPTGAFSSSLSFEPTAGSVLPTVIYVRLSSAAAVAGSPYSGNILCTSPGAAPRSVPTGISVVTAAPLTIIGVTAESKVYDGSTASTLTGVAAYSGLVNDESFLVAGAVEAVFASRNAAVNKSVIVSGYEAPSTNYSLAQPSLTADIEPRVLIVTDAGVVAKAYDGNTDAVITGTLTGVIGNDEVTLEGVGTFASAGPGSTIAVTSVCTLAGADAPNYRLIQPAGLSGAILGDDNAALSGLFVNQAILSPAFDPEIVAYTTTVASEVSSVTLTPITASEVASVCVNGTPVTSGTPSALINLALGNNQIVLEITAQDQITTKTYTVTVNRGGNGGVLSFASAEYSVNPVNAAGEPSTVQVQIDRSSAVGGEISVTLTAAQPRTVPPGQAKLAAGRDYTFTPNPKVIFFADGETSKIVDIPLIAKARAGQFCLEVSSPTGGASIGTLPEESKTLVTVQKRDSVPPVLTVPTPTPGLSGVVTIAGIAMDNGTPSTGIDRVELSVKHINSAGAPEPLTLGPGGAFSRDVQLEHGKNSIVVTAYDGSGLRVAKSFNLPFSNSTLTALAGTYSGLVSPAVEVSNDTSGLITVTVTPTAAVSGRLALGGVNVSFAGTLDNSGNLHFKPTSATHFDVIDRTDFESYLGSLSVHVETGHAYAILKTSATGTSLASAVARQHAPGAVSTLLNAGAAQRYTVVIPSGAEDQPTAADHPQGDGYGTIMVMPSGVVSLVGVLADGTTYGASGRLQLAETETQRVALHANLYRRTGSFATELVFDLSAAANQDSDVRGESGRWIRPALPRARYYKSGWANGAVVTALGSRFTATAGQSFVPGLGTAAPNAALVFADADLAAPTTRLVDVNPLNSVKNHSAPLDPALKLSLSAKTGVFQGAFTNDADGKPTPFKGIILQEGANRGGYGYFLSTPAPAYDAVGLGGRVRLRGN